MPSEKSRYLNRKRGPMPPMDFNELKDHLPSLGSERLADLLWIRAEQDEILRKVLMAAVGIQSASGDFEKAKIAIDYALHFPDFIRYTEDGHGQILEEIKVCLENIANNGKREFAIRVARHAIDRGQEVAENFQDDWDWTSSLKNLSEWANKMTE